MNYNQDIPNSFPFERIEQLHSEMTLMDKIVRISFLQRKEREINSLINNLAYYCRLKGGFLSAEEKECGRRLLDMQSYLQSQKNEANRDFSNELFKELVKTLLKH